MPRAAWCRFAAQQERRDGELRLHRDKAFELQRLFDTTVLAAAELQVIVHDTLSPADRAFVGRMDQWGELVMQGDPLA
jgi:hypothetical protein